MVSPVGTSLELLGLSEFSDPCSLASVSHARFILNLFLPYWPVAVQEEYRYSLPPLALMCCAAWSVCFLLPVRVELLLHCCSMLLRLPSTLVMQPLALHLLSKRLLILPSSSASTAFMILCLLPSLCRTLDVAHLDTNEHALQPSVAPCFRTSVF